MFECIFMFRFSENEIIMKISETGNDKRFYFVKILSQKGIIYFNTLITIFPLEMSAVSL